MIGGIGHHLQLQQETQRSQPSPSVCMPWTLLFCMINFQVKMPQRQIARKRGNLLVILSPQTQPVLQRKSRLTRNLLKVQDPRAAGQVRGEKIQATAKTGNRLQVCRSSLSAVFFKECTVLLCIPARPMVEIL